MVNKRSQLQNLKYEEWSNLILDSMQEAMYFVDLAGNCILINQKFLKTLGYDNKEYFIGKNIHDLIHYKSENSLPLNKKDCKIEKAIIRGERGVLGNTVLWKKDGSKIIVEFASNPIFIENNMVGAVVTFRDINDRLSLMKELRLEKNKANEYLDIVEVIILALNKNGTIKLINEKGSKLLGLSKKDILGKFWFGLFANKDETTITYERYRKVIQKEIELVSSYEENIVTVNGEKRTISWNSTLLYDKNNNVIGILSSGEDVTEKNAAIKKLKENEIKYKNLFDNAPFMYQSLDGLGYIIDVNYKWIKLLQYSKEEVLGKWFGDFLLPEYAEKFKKKLATITTEELIQSSYKIRTKLGKIIDVDISGTIVYDKDGHISYTHCLLNDFSEIKRTHDQLNYEKYLAQKYLDIVEVIIIGLDTLANVRLINKKGCNLLGLNKVDIIGKSWIDLFIPKDKKDKTRKRFSQIINREIDLLRNYEEEILTISGDKRIISWNATFLYDKNHNITGLLSSGEDITERKIKERILIESEDRLKRSQLIAKVGSWELDLNTQLIWASEEAYSIYELPYNSEYIDLKKIQGVLSSEYRLKLDQALKNLIENNAKYDIIFPLNTFSKTKWIHSQAELSYDEKGRPKKVLGVIMDVTAMKKNEISLIDISTHDYLTGLNNRRYFVEMFNTLDKPKYYPICIMMIDVNGLKIINDAFGHNVGDQALIRVANTIKNNFRKNDIISRLGGDEFGIILPKVTNSEIEELNTNLLNRISKEHINNISLSIATGYELKGKDDNEHLDDLLKKAENHMYRHKLSVGMSIRNNAIKAILKTLTDKFSEEKIHSIKVKQLCKKMGKALGLKEENIKELELAGMYHDIGKISIPDAILNKPGKLTNEEFVVIKTHPKISYQILRAADEYSDLAIHALYHHERWDGLGYPSGKKGEDIPLFSRIICIVDAYEAMTAVRTYKDKMTKSAAIQEIISCSGTQFDPRLAKIFIVEVLGEKWES